jgi:predicted MFS family arabinose efflux permease
MIQTIPIVELFLAGVFAIISTETVKWLFNIRESSIGLHSGNTGQLMKSRNATIIFTLIIFTSNILSFVIYTYVHDSMNTMIPIGSMGVDVLIVLSGIAIVWVYLKKNHYNRSSS